VTDAWCRSAFRNETTTSSQQKAARPAATTSSRDSSAGASGCAGVPEGAFPVQHLRDKRQELVVVPPSTIHHPPSVPPMTASLVVSGRTTGEPRRRQVGPGQVGTEQSSGPPS
jgi:hypothetical protein